MIKNIIKLFINSLYLRYLKIKGINVGSKIFINGRILFSGTRKVSIGNDVYINSKIKANPIGGNTQCMFKTDMGGAIEIGNRCRMSNVVICSFMKVRIEDDVYIGGDVRIYDTDFHSLDFSNRVSPVDNNIKSLPVLIKHGAFIGASSIILKGVTVGEYSIIGAGSVVTKNIPNGEIWAGNPAKFLKKVE